MTYARQPSWRNILYSTEAPLDQSWITFLCKNTHLRRLGRQEKKRGSLFVSRTMIWDSASPSTDPWGMPLITGLHLDMKTLITTPYPPTGPSIRSMPLHFRDKDAVWDGVKCTAQVYVDINIIPHRRKRRNRKQKTKPGWRKGFSA